GTGRKAWHHPAASQPTGPIIVSRPETPAWAAILIPKPVFVMAVGLVGSGRRLVQIEAADTRPLANNRLVTLLLAVSADRNTDVRGLVVQIFIASRGMRQNAPSASVASTIPTAKARSRIT